MRPHVTINMAMSVDGKISTRLREDFSFGSKEDRHLMDVLRARADAVLVGARTVAIGGWAIRVRDRDIRRKRVASGRTLHPLNVVLTRTLDLSSTKQFFTHNQTRRLVITTQAASDVRVRRFKKCAEVIVLPARRIRASRALKLLAERGIRRVLVEGGGTLNYAFFEEGLVDEIYVTITPRIIAGADAPTVVDGKGFLAANLFPLELVSSRRKDNEVFLRYRAVRR